MSTISGLHISGVTRDGHGPRRTLINPATGLEVAEVSEGSVADAQESVSAARGAFASWSGRTAGERSRILLRLADLIESHGEELSKMEVSDSGKPFTTFLEGEIPFAVDNLRCSPITRRKRRRNSKFRIYIDAYSKAYRSRSQYCSLEFPFGDGYLEDGSSACCRKYCCFKTCAGNSSNIFAPC